MMACNKDHLIKNREPQSHREMLMLGAAKPQGPLGVTWENSKPQTLDLQMPGAQWITSTCYMQNIVVSAAENSICITAPVLNILLISAVPRSLLYYPLSLNFYLIEVPKEIA